MARKAKAETTEAKTAPEAGLLDATYDGIPGSDPLSEEDTAPFQEDLSFGLDGEGNPIEEPEEEENPIEEPKEEEQSEEVEEDTTDQAEGDEPKEEATAKTDDTPEESEEGDKSTEESNEEPVVEEAKSDDVVEEKEKKKSPMVPKARLDEVLAKQKALQKKLDEKTAKEAEVMAEAPQYDFEIKETEYQEAILDGDIAKANSVRSEIRAAEREQTMFEVQQKMGQTVQQSQQLINLQTAAKELEVSYPILDENSQEFNADIQKEVIELRDAFVVQGYDAADALKKAATYTLAVQAPEALNPVEPETKVEDKKVTAITEKKKRATVKKKLEAADSQPPELQGEGNAERGEAAVDITKLSEDEFNALPEETLRRLRGDFG